MLDWMNEAQAGIKIAGRNINNLRYADGTTIMAESEKELKSLLMKVKEESEKVGQTTLPASLEICMQVKKPQLEPDMQQWTGSRLGKE